MVTSLFFLRSRERPLGAPDLIKKNNNAHVEGKNWTHILHYLGYQRFDNPILVKLLNDLFTSERYLYFNFFIPSMKYIDKICLGSKIIKKNDTLKHHSSDFRKGLSILQSKIISEKSTIYPQFIRPAITNSYQNKADSENRQ